MSPRSQLVAIAFATVLGGGPLGAQGLPIELGQDLGFTVGFNGSTVTNLSLPSGSFRVGFHVSPLISVEPEVSLSYTNIEDAGSVTLLGAALTLPVHLVKDRTRVQPYLRPGVGITLIDVEGSASQFQAGAGLGVKAPIAERLAARIEGGVAHGFENDDFAGVTTIALSVGFSFYTR